MRRPSAGRRRKWLDDYAVQLLDGDHAALRDAQAALRGHLRLDELSAAQKARRVAETTAAGVTGPDALYRPADGEDDGSDEKPLTAEDVAAFAGKPLSDRMQAAEPGLPPEEAIRCAMRD